MEALQNLIDQVQDVSSLAALESKLADLGNQLGYSSCTIIAVDDTGDTPVIQQKVGVDSELMRAWLQANIIKLTEVSRVDASPSLLREIEPNHAPNAFLLPLGANTLQKNIITRRVLPECYRRHYRKSFLVLDDIRALHP